MWGPKPGKCEDCGVPGPRVEVPWGGITGTNEGKSVCLDCAPKYLKPETKGNECSQCHRVGSVGETEHRSGVRISWTCSVCRNYVCIDCALRLPGSVPPELYEETLCSEECRQRSGAPSDSVARARGLISHHELIELRAIVANWKGCEQVELVNCSDLQDRIARACQALGIFFGIEQQIVETGQMLEALALRAQEKD